MSATYPAGLTGNTGETLALTTTYATLGIPGMEVKQAILYTPSVDFRMTVNPAIKAVYLYDNSQTGTAKWRDLTLVLTDRSATGTTTYMDSLTASDRLFICFADTVRGFQIDMTASVNATASVLTPKYWNGAWTDPTATDGSITGTASLGKTGPVTWTAVTDWKSAKLGGPSNAYGTPYASIDSGLDTAEVLTATDTGITMDADPSSAIVAGDHILIGSEVMYVNISSATANLLTVTRGALGSTAATHSTNADTYIYNIGGPSIEGFWVACEWSGGLDSDTEIANLWSINKSTSYGYFRAGQEYFISFDRRAVGALEFDLAAGTDTAEITWIRTIV